MSGCWLDAGDLTSSVFFLFTVIIFISIMHINAFPVHHFVSNTSPRYLWPGLSLPYLPSAAAAGGWPGAVRGGPAGRYGTVAADAAGGAPNTAAGGPAAIRDQVAFAGRPRIAHPDPTRHGSARQLGRRFRLILGLLRRRRPNAPVCGCGAGLRVGSRSARRLSPAACCPPGESTAVGAATSG